MEVVKTTGSVKPGERRFRILLVEDDLEMREAIREVLQMSGFIVHTAADGDEAALLALADAFDVLLSDIRLPGQSGIALARSLKGRAHPPKIILITAYPEWKVYEEATVAGAAAVISKPLDLFKLAGVVQEVARSGNPAA